MAAPDPAPPAVWGVARPSSAQTGLLIASALTSETFAPSLAPRSAIDQGLVTGLSVASHYLVAVAAQDLLSGVADRLVGSTFLVGSTWFPQEHRARLLEIAVDLLAVPVGTGAALLVPAVPRERTARALARFVGCRIALSGAAGAALDLGHAGAVRLDSALGRPGTFTRLPQSVPLGAAVAYVVERNRSHQHAPTPDLASVSSNSRLVSVLVAGGVVVGLSGFAAAEGLLTRRIGEALHLALPGTSGFWRVVARGASLGAVTTAGVALWDRAMQRIETATLSDEARTAGLDPSAVTQPTVSGSGRSLVPWDSLGREGRRHVLSRVPTKPPAAVDPAGRPDPADTAGTTTTTDDSTAPAPGRASRRPFVDALVGPTPGAAPDFSIETVMGRPAVAEPVQVYVGLDSAPTARDRVDLALAEMERLGAFDRSLLVLVSPTGTGYVNYVALAALQYLALGDVATVTMQYSKRPSPLSLGKVSVAREQNRRLWMRVLVRLREIPEHRRPRVVVFGESLGALTSQDVFVDWGTIGPAALGIDRALWVGTPRTSRWMTEVTTPDRLEVDPDTVAVVNDHLELDALGAERRARLRYVLVNHDNDGVTRLAPDVLLSRPDWLGPEARPPRPAPVRTDVPVSPRGTPPWARWRPVTTFFQTLVDMKNAQAPGPYRAWAHDYRPDLLRFVSTVYDLPADPEVLRRLDGVLEDREELRETLIAHADERRRAAGDGSPSRVAP